MKWSQKLRALFFILFSSHGYAEDICPVQRLGWGTNVAYSQFSFNERRLTLTVSEDIVHKFDYGNMDRIQFGSVGYENGYFWFGWTREVGSGLYYSGPDLADSLVAEGYFAYLLKLDNQILVVENIKSLQTNSNSTDDYKRMALIHQVDGNHKKLFEVARLPGNTYKYLSVASATGLPVKVNEYFLVGSGWAYHLDSNGELKKLTCWPAT